MEERSIDIVELLVESSGQATALLDPSARIRRHNPALARLLGRSSAEIDMASLLEFVHPRDRSEAAVAVFAHMSVSGTRSRLELEFSSRDGSPQLIELSLTNLLEEPGVGGILTHARDLTDRRHAEQRLLHDAQHDGLTKLLNRTLLLDRVAQQIVATRGAEGGFALLVVAVESLQLVNDNLGYGSGDALLLQLTERLLGCVRPGDTLARVTENEFALLIRGGGEKEATSAVERIRERLEAPFRLQGEDTFCTASIGFVVANGGYGSPEAVLRDATLAADHARDGGGDRWTAFDPRMRVAIDGRLKLGSELRRALEREELEIHYQPIVELETGELHALEALLRWRHPVDGLVTPGRFMPVAEETGLILPIGWWVLDSVCAQISTWVGRGLEAVPVHVNVASVQLSGGQLTRRVEGALLQHDCPGRLLHLELTESMVVNRKDEAAEVLRALKSSGVGLSIDDFGTGYSSLSYLHRFPADVLKVDRSFVSHLGRSGDDAKLVRTIVHLGHDLGMRVVAEGIEEGAQVARLKGMECDFGQGFFFSPALPPDEVASLLAGRTVGQAHEIAL